MATPINRSPNDPRRVEAPTPAILLDALVGDDKYVDRIAPFLHAQKVLEYLNENGIECKAILHYDGSGRLLIQNGDRIGPKIRERLHELLHSHRWEQYANGELALIRAKGWQP